MFRVICDNVDIFFDAPDPAARIKADFEITLLVWFDGRRTDDRGGAPSIAPGPYNLQGSVARIEKLKSMLQHGALAQSPKVKDVTVKLHVGTMELEFLGEESERANSCR